MPRSMQKATIRYKATIETTGKIDKASYFTHKLVYQRDKNNKGNSSFELKS
jgi:hypothetical protein